MKTQIFVILMTVLLIFNVYGLHFNDGYVHDVNSVINELTYVQNDPFWDYPTTVNIVEGGYISSIYSMNESVLNICGGSSTGVMGWDNSTIHILSGNVNGWIVTRNYSECVIDGGIFNSIQIQVIESSNLKIYNGLFIFGESDDLNISGGSVTIYGSGFSINGRPVSNGTYDDNVSGILTGTLSGGDSIEIPFTILSPAKLILVSELEPYCTEYPSMDFNRDCKVDLADFAEFASQWVICNLEPKSYCN